MSRSDLLDELLLLTPEPPGPDADLDQLISAAEEMIARRALVYGSATHAALPPSSDRRLRRLQELDRRWAAVLSTARLEAGERLQAISRLARRSGRR